jgi:hypothetical protein
MKNLLFILLLLFNLKTFSQELSQDLKLKKDLTSHLSNDTTQFYILGEDHYEQNYEHKLTLLFGLNESIGLNKLGVEMPVSFEFYINNFLLNDDLTIFTILDEVFKNTKQNFRTILLEIYGYNFYHENKISVFCVDIPMYSYSSTGTSLYYNFKNVKNIDKLKLNDVLNKDTKSIKRSESIELTRVLVDDFRKNKNKYLEILDSSFVLFNTILKGMEIAYSHNQVFSYEFNIKREEYILNNILENTKNGEKCVIFCGLDHVSKKDCDTLLVEKCENSFTNMLIDKYSKNVISIGVEYSRTRFQDFFHFGESYIFSEEVRRNRTKKPYYILDKEELEELNGIDSMYDAVIIKNVRLGNKNYKKNDRAIMNR